jgi:hypothetical protein
VGWGLCFSPHLFGADLLELFPVPDLGLARRHVPLADAVGQHLQNPDGGLGKNRLMSETRSQRCSRLERFSEVMIVYFNKQYCGNDGWVSNSDNLY